MNFAPPEMRITLSRSDRELAEEVGHWLPVLRRLLVDGSTMLSVARSARATSNTFKAELLAWQVVSEEALYRALADEAGLDFLEAVDPDQLIAKEADCVTALARGDLRTLARLDGPSLAMTLLIAPTEGDLATFARLRREGDAVRQRICVVTPSALRAALTKRSQPYLMRDASSGLFETTPQYSARLVVCGWQGIAFGSFITAAILLSFVYSLQVLLAFHVIGIVFFLGCALLRLRAGMTKPRAEAFAFEGDMEEAPRYSVLVALYREADMVPQLLTALSRLTWPRNRLEIKLVCEEDDFDTLEAIRAHQLRNYVEVVEVPPHGPRTKPKALRYALPLTTGEFVVLYDAEDRPHPFQLVQAWQRFRGSPDEVVCLQAQLEISNRTTLISRMFAAEYAGLFRGLLPWLADRGQVLPLGGTSNHFRRQALVEIGSWDPHNVTEDADLGVRLARRGYRAETISLPTVESAPDDWATWFPQRTRWFKGWMQSWLVHSRDPAQLWRELGASGFAVAQMLLAGMALSALLHPVFFLVVLWCGTAVMLGYTLSTMQAALLAVDAATLVFSYGAFLFLVWRQSDKQERAAFLPIALFTPLYWLMLSHAAWAALIELVRDPHRWNKTAHTVDAGSGIGSTFSAGPVRQ